MTLPANGAAWPPPSMAAPYAEMRVNDAWYSGDKDRLARIYSTAPNPRERRKLWGRKRTYDDVAGRRDPRLHIPLAGDIASTSADLLFADLPTVTFAETAAQDRYNVLVNEGALAETLLGAADVASPLAGVYLRVTWDRELVSRPLITVMQPDGAVPTFRFGMLRAVTFWRQLSADDSHTVWRHLEHHEPGFIRHGLYRGTSDNLGKVHPLTDHAETEDIAATLDAEGDGQTIATGTRDLTAVYVPNMRPNRLHRGSPLGRSDLSLGVHDQLNALDETWTSWMRDIRLGRSRIIVPDGYLRSNGPGDGASFDADREVWAGINQPPTEQGAGITLNQFAIRVEEHQRTGEAIVRQVAQMAGYSPQSFGIDGDGDGEAATATLVNSRDARSMVTRKKKTGYWDNPLAHIVHVWAQLDALLFRNTTPPAAPPTVEFGPGVAESAQSTATTVDMLSRAEAISTDTKVRMVHPDWEDPAVAAEVARILAETGAAQPDPVGSFPM